MVSVLIDAGTLKATDPTLRGEAVRALRVMLRPLQHDVRRAEMRLLTIGERQVCRVSVWFIQDEQVTVEEAAASARGALWAAADSLREALEWRPAAPLRRRHQRLRPQPRRRWPSQTAREQQSTGPPASRWRGARGTGARHRVLVALPQLAYPRVFPERSRLLQAVLRTELHVLKVLGGLRAGAKESGGQWRDRERVLRAEHETRAWYQALLGDEPPATHVGVCIGDFVSEVAARAAAIGATVIVLPDTDEPMGSAAVALARGAFRPVLVARPLVSGNTLLAALDRDDEHHPVLEAAELLAAELGAPVVALCSHDVDADTLNPAARGPLRTDCSTAVSGQHTKTGATLLLTADDDRARAIVREARVRDVDTILVGARPPSLFERLQGQDVVADVVDDADHSVLIMPLAAGERFDDSGPSRGVLH